MEFSLGRLINPAEENATPGTLKAIQVALVEPVAYLTGGIAVPRDTVVARGMAHDSQSSNMICSEEECIPPAPHPHATGWRGQHLSEHHGPGCLDACRSQWGGGAACGG